MRERDIEATERKEYLQERGWMWKWQKAEVEPTPQPRKLYNDEFMMLRPTVRREA